MVNLILEKATEIQLKVNIVNNSTINVETKHDYSVYYSEDEKSCRAALQIGVVSQSNPDELSILCTVQGDFVVDHIENDDDKRRIHVECYNSLFPYAQQLLARLCNDSALPPFFFPKHDIKEEDVVIK